MKTESNPTRTWMDVEPIDIPVGQRKTAHGSPSFLTSFNRILLFGITSLPFRFLLRWFTSCGADLFPPRIVFFYTEQTRSRRPLFLLRLGHFLFLFLSDICFIGCGVSSSVGIGAVLRTIGSSVSRQIRVIVLFRTAPNRV